MYEIEAVLVCPECGEVGVVTRVSTGNEGVFQNNLRPLQKTGCGLPPNKCPKVARKQNG